MYKETTEESRDFALALAKAAIEKKAENVIIVDLTMIENAVSNYLLICSCTSTSQLDAVVSELHREAKNLGHGKVQPEGMNAKEWALIDYFDVVVHAMLPETRSYYKLEKLWADIKMEMMNEDGSLRPFNAEELKEMYIEFDREEFNGAGSELGPDFWEFDAE